MHYIDLIGFGAGILTTSSFIPQAYKVFKTKSTRDLSLGMFSVMTCGAILWLIYGFLINNLPTICANLVTVPLSLYILVMKIKKG